MDKMNEVQKAAYLEAYMAQQAAAFQHQNKFRYDSLPASSSGHEEKKKSSSSAINGLPTSVPSKMFNNINSCSTNYGTTIKVPQIQATGSGNLDSTFTVPDDGLGFDDGVRVLRTLGSWTPDYRPTSGILFPDLPYSHSDVNVNQRKITSSVLPSPLPVSQSSSSGLARPSPSLAPPKKEEVNSRSPIVQNNHQTSQQSPIQTPNNNKTNGVSHNNSSTSNKSFTCTICGKSLARKDKLVIHTRIHTGEKPYVCEVCDKAFARRDKLVIHMNKMKHRTPTNIAPLGKRTNTDKSKKQIQPPIDEEPEIPKNTALNIQTAAANWSCELCGQMMTTREEWMVHAKAHLEEKITGMGVISPTNYNNQRNVNNYTANSVHIPPMTSLNNPPYLPQHGGPYQPFNITDRQFCPVCRQAFSNKAEFMLHVRVHFDNVTKPSDVSRPSQATSSSSSSSMIDNSTICS